MFSTSPLLLSYLSKVDIYFLKKTTTGRELIWNDLSSTRTLKNCLVSSIQIFHLLEQAVLFFDESSIVEYVQSHFFLFPPFFQPLHISLPLTQLSIFLLYLFIPTENSKHNTKIWHHESIQFLKQVIHHFLFIYVFTSILILFFSFPFLSFFSFFSHLLSSTFS